jgi:putative selenium metabolism protein SsnA
VLAGGLVARTLSGPLEAADLVVSGGRIGGEAEGAARIDVSGCVVIPGLVCAHHHLYSTLARGMPGPVDAPRNFLEILERVWWRLDRALDIETVHLSALAGAVHAARCGTTAIIDHHASPHAIDSSLDAIADAVDDAGVRAVLCYEVSDRHGEAGGRAGVEENARFAASNARDRVRAMAGGHASFTIGPATMEALVATARESGVPLHIHVAEDAIDERDALERYGMRTVERLAQEGALAEGDLIAHGVHLDDAELALVRASGTWVAHNPRSNLNNAVGYAPAPQLGPRVGLGTDGIDGDMCAELRTCFLEARAHGAAPDPMWSVERLAAGATIAAASFAEPSLGTLDHGAPADLVILDYDPPTPLESANLAGHLLFGVSSASVRDVMVAGRWIVRDHRHQLIDERELAASCRRAAPEIWAKMQGY